MGCRCQFIFCCVAQYCDDYSRQYLVERECVCQMARNWSWTRQELFLAHSVEWGWIDRPCCCSWQMYDDGLLSYCLAENTNCWRLLLSYKMTAKRAQVSDWPNTSRPSESDIPSFLYNEIDHTKVSRLFHAVLLYQRRRTCTRKPMPVLIYSLCI